MCGEGTKKTLPQIKIRNKMADCHTENGKNLKS